MTFKESYEEAMRYALLHMSPGRCANTVALETARHMADYRCELDYAFWYVMRRNGFSVALV